MSLIVVCGGRDFDDRAVVYSALDRLHAKQPITVLAEGGARGADALANQWATERGVKVETFGAPWLEFGKRAGHERNARMVVWAKEHGARGLVAFPGGRGTADAVRQARARGIVVWEVVP